MGRKRWWKASLELSLLCLLPQLVLGDGEIGCLFSQNVCRTELETCYDDFAFGRCIRAFGELQDEDIYRYDLDSTELDLLRRQLERLVVGGYAWTHPYTQCVMQTSLYSLRFRIKHETDVCQKLINVEERNFDTYGAKDETDDGSQPLAVVNFTPIRGHGYGDFANEKYYPPVSSRKPTYEKNDFSNEYSYGTSPFRGENSENRNRLANVRNVKTDVNDENEFVMESPREMNLDDESNEGGSRNFRELTQRLNIKHDEKPIYRLRRQPHSDFSRNLKSAMNDDEYETSRDDEEKFEKIVRSQRYKNLMDKNLWNFMLINETLPKRNDEDSSKLEFLRDYNDNEGENEVQHWLREENGDGRDANQQDEEIEQDDNQEAISRLEASLERLNNRRKSGAYSENRFVNPIDLDQVMREEAADADFEDDLNKLLWNSNLAAFQRPERVDVKKPGPLYSTNNYAFKTQSPSAPIPNDNDLDIEIDTKDDLKILRSPQMKKNTVVYNGKQYENVDIDHLYLQFNSEFTKWSDGEEVVETVAKLLGLNPDTFSNVRVGRAEVTFKVTNDPYTGHNDALAIAPKIEQIHAELKKITGKQVVRAGIGDKVKLPPAFDIEGITAKPMSPGLFGVTVAAAGAAAAAAAVVTLIIARKHAKSRAKLAGLATPDPEASKDYQDLCRARMQAKQPSDKPESPRIVSLSRESESARSSTSSWGEEAAALTNMDISTGHMVLTYMEDRLKNKDRLDQEWAGICAYEADPSSVATAMEKSNADRNRPGSSLPYDHSRVVLNDLSSANNSDYINASTITDHDPRNPAYIATQGPLPQTSADFWQLVWEQGSVVIVMLTRLTEEGRGMCHRYWPEEGSELYHIYEVHLVSEHIWCDDYLVRSFYLKNLRTGETRTVTQFHFLSWPENGVPQSTKALLEFRRKVNKSYRGRSCPIVVHCSDGAGRTGTYCLIDMVLNRMAKGAKEIDIAAALEHIRDQRPGMVATKQQFEFVLVAVAEEVHAILKALPVQALADKPQTNVIVTSASTTQSSASSGSEQ
ncbi:receptor-type tyrosine-protein phosphatase N2 isoform X2 [Venturia canescens]|uniref:receptor-type tyrosine-protein phosphatase N2 isoform X2 n=1 Tax=Venturia canescens TaxID=32260 RepID=UPI001C9C344D|nr:receptor-type tyrosine-protein phosphatase N2 isoform X2 [Venturia canescens]